MKVAVVALVCVVRFAVPAQASEPVRPGPDALAPAVVTPAAVPTALPLLPLQIEPRDISGTHGAGVTPRPATGPAIKEPPHDQAKPRSEAARRMRVCFGPAETRATVAERRLTEPFRALRVGGQQGEALRAKLCRWRKDEFVYEISVLRRDGRILHLYMNAQSGQSVGALDDNDRH